MVNSKTQKKENRKPGRPRKMVRDIDDLPVEIHTTISKKAHDMVPKDVRWKDLVEEVIYARYGNQEEIEISLLQKKIDELQFEMARVRVELEEKKRNKEREEELRKALRIEEKYPAFAFRNFIASQIKMKKGLPPITVNDKFIQERWGISFDKEKLNHDIEENDFRVDFEENLITNEEMVEKYSIKKVSSQAELAREITQTIEKEVGLA